MSRWLTDELHVSLSPDQVGVVHVRRSPGFTHINREVIGSQSITCIPDPDDAPWSVALKALDSLLPQFSTDRLNVIIVLSNHFVRYVLVPWSDLVTSEDQQLAYTRHYFQSTYGTMSDAWELRLSRTTVGAAQIASAIDQSLMTACHELTERQGMKLKSVQPYLMSAFNRLKLQFEGVNAWFALGEPGNICLAQLHQGQWLRLRTSRLGNAWDEFSRFLQREAMMGSSEFLVGTQVLYLHAPHLGKSQTISGWKIIDLPSPLPTGLKEENERSLVMALSGTTSGI